MPTYSRHPAKGINRSWKSGNRWRRDTAKTSVAGGKELLKLKTTQAHQKAAANGLTPVVVSPFHSGMRFVPIESFCVPCRRIRMRQRLPQAAFHLVDQSTPCLRMSTCSPRRVTRQRSGPQPRERWACSTMYAVDCIFDSSFS
ncbi:hypothetical protein FA10DRAFT_113611 [Acaromyces ingoldii]|uniref:Uncharacterized protein n=1 Tax=Acaromyces ingoldii TaxID=215250 RepID=A0A316YQY4_9BASI|nr:hypothetical protein FA10DRAFT_113611 [Acaromyces ingoldii]PWN90443.1 hypothetical protein FA10DRAFT_113611 [Acaromyces ingoldii]